MTSYILGFNCYMEDASAALLKNGEVVAAVQEERLTRKKHDGSFPRRAIAKVLEIGGISVQDLEHVAFNFSPFHDFHRRLFSVARRLPQSLAFAASHGPSWFSMLRIEKTFRREVGAGDHRFHCVRHHLAHAASAFYVSPFEEAAVLTVDGSGESASTMLAAARGNHIEVLESLHFPQSLGYLYAAITQYLGFKNNSGEGKVMGLASYGEPEFLVQMREVARSTGDGLYHLDLSYFRHHKGAPVFWSNKVTKTFGHEPRRPESEILPFHENLAESLQRRLEELCYDLMRRIHEKTGLKRLCLAGGVALNCSMNGGILANTDFEDVFIQPGANDAGGGLGAALFVWHEVLGGVRSGEMRNAYLGPEYTQDDIEKAVPRGYSVEKVDPVECAAELLSRGRYLGWYQGRSELGPRALGARSILADPRVPDMVDRLNARVKFREAFRPFAPSALEAKTHEWFEDYTRSPFMLLKCMAKKSRAAEIPAVVHVDGSSRVQGVTAEDCPQYHRLISRFEEKTGIPLVLNTSFNLRGEPNVETPADAFRTFEKSGLEDLVIGNLHVQKQDEAAPEAAAASTQAAGGD